jgi:hypothetical protein
MRLFEILEIIDYLALCVSILCQTAFLVVGTYIAVSIPHVVGAARKSCAAQKNLLQTGRKVLDSEVPFVDFHRSETQIR